MFKPNMKVEKEETKSKKATKTKAKATTAKKSKPKKETSEKKEKKSKKKKKEDTSTDEDLPDGFMIVEEEVAVKSNPIHKRAKDGDGKVMLNKEKLTKEIDKHGKSKTL